MKIGQLLKYTFLCLLILGLLYHAWVAIQIFWWRTHPPHSTAFMQTVLYQLQEQDPNAKIAYQWVPYERISKSIKKAVIAAEDEKFIYHHGFDWEGIQYAWERNIKKGRIVAGGSTISQQLAKNLFLSKSKNPFRKLEEAIITLMLEAILPKKRIFELYLNVIQWGDHLFGIEMAARHYYHTSAAKLSSQQAAQLAAFIPNPRYYGRYPHDRQVKKLKNIIQQRMPLARIP